MILPSPAIAFGTCPARDPIEGGSAQTGIFPLPVLKLPPFLRRFDPRLAADLRKQRRTIAMGIACVAVAAILDGATLPLLDRSITAIQQAAPQQIARKEQTRIRLEVVQKQLREASEKLGTTPEAVDQAFAEFGDEIDQRQTQDVAEVLAQPLGTSSEAVREVLQGVGNQTTGNREAVNRLGILSLMVVALFAIKYWFTRGQAFFLTMAAARLSSDLRSRMFAKLQRLPVSYFGQKRVGAIQSVLTNDVNVYQSAVQVIRDSIDGPVKALIAFGYVLYTQWQLAGVTLLFLPPMAYVINRNGRKMRAAQRQVQNDQSDLAAATHESLQGMRVVKAFSAEAQAQDRYDGLVEQGFKSQIFAARRFASLRPLVELLGAAALASVLYICGWLSFLGELQLGQIAALIFALDRINQGLRSIGNVTNTYNQVQAANIRIHEEVLDVPEQVESEGARVLENPQGRIEFRNVTFRYPDGTEALRGVSFVLEPGTSLALVGPSGAGKSTIADLVLRFYDPSEGQVLLDGVDVRELKLDWLRNQIGVVPQQTFLFAGSVSENIRMGKPDATEAEVLEAATSAHADEFVQRLDRNYLAEVGEGGSRLSGGQRQRLAIARALVRKPSVLLLDEATSALDPTSEQVVTEALSEVMRQRTTLFIAHRLTTAARADRILVLSRGEVVEQGSHTELLAANGAYAGLFRAFSGGVLG